MEHRRALRKGPGMCWARWLLNMCLHQATRWTCPRPGLWTLTLTPRPAVYWTPGTSNVNRPLSTVRRARCQNSTDSAEVIMQPTGIDFPSYDYLTIIIIITYYYCWHCILLFSHSSLLCFPARTSPLPHMTCHHLSIILY